MIVLTAALSAACLSCLGPDPVGIAATDTLPALASEPGAATPLRGCARFEVALSGREGVTVTTHERPECGPIRPVLAGEAELDRTTRTLRLPIALENAGTRKAKAPAWLLGWEDSLEVVEPLGQARNEHTAGSLSLAGPDSVVADGAAELPGARAWAYDTLLAHPDSAQRLAAGARSRARWIELRVHPGVLRLSATFHARALRASPPVPPVAPDSIPLWIGSDSSWVDTPCVGRAVRNVIVVAFVPTASTDAREEALSLVDGEVVGGDLGGPDGHYYVRIPSDLLCNAESILLESPHVRYVELILPPASPLYVRPADAAPFDRWQVRHEEADGGNWAPESISAPLAWGCATGTDDTPVAIVDAGFYAVDDLLQNSTYRDAAEDLPPDTSHPGHGTRVAAIAAARGGNGTGITGMSWRADLRLLDVRVNASGDPVNETVNTQLDRIVTAARRGARVVNFSFGYTWKQMTGSLPTTSNQQHHNRVRDYARRLRRRLDRIDSLDVVVVLAAGNNPLDAYWSGYPQVQSTHGDKVLVVTAVDSRDSLWAYSGGASQGYGAGRNVDSTFVEVGAPGARVSTLTADGSTVVSEGTSLAAPHVTGLAGLLFSFDPRLTAPEVKALIVEGARRSGRAADGIPIIDAYESLKLAARRPGAPLCGNRLWATGDGFVHVQRDTAPGAPAESIDVSALLGSGEPVLVGDADVLHGGRQVRLRTSIRSQRGIRWTPAGWVVDASLSGRWTDPHPGSSGAYLSASHFSTSKYARSHGGDTLLLGARTGTLFDLLLTLSGPGGVVRQTTLGGSRPPPQRLECVLKRAGEPAETGCLVVTPVPSDGESTEWGWALSPAGGGALAAAQRIATRGSWGGWYACGPYRQRHSVGDTTVITVIAEEADCRDHTADVTHAGTEVYSLSLPDLTVRERWSVAGAADEIQGVSEDGAELLVERVTGGTTWVIAWDTEKDGVRRRARSSDRACRVLALRADPSGVRLWDGPSCFGQSVTPTIAPERRIADARPPRPRAPAPGERPGWGPAVRLALLRLIG